MTLITNGTKDLNIETGSKERRFLHVDSYEERFQMSLCYVFQMPVTHICMYIYICIYVVLLYICIYIYIYMYIYVCIYTCVCVDVHRIFPRRFLWRAFPNVVVLCLSNACHAYMYKFIYICICVVLVYICARIYVCTYMYVSICMGFHVDSYEERFQLFMCYLF